MQRIKKILLLAIFAASSVVLHAQSKTTERLEEKYKDSFTLFFYHNTLRMINQQEDSDFDELIRDIEKMKLLIIRKNQAGFDYAGIKKDYSREHFEEIMTSRHEGRNFDIFVREENGKTKGMLVLVHDGENLFVLDILGSLALNKVTKLYTVLDNSSDIGSTIKKFVDKDDDKKKKK